MSLICEATCVGTCVHVCELNICLCAYDKIIFLLAYTYTLTFGLILLARKLPGNKVVVYAQIFTNATQRLSIFSRAMIDKKYMAWYLKQRERDEARFAGEKFAQRKLNYA